MKQRIDIVVPDSVLAENGVRKERLARTYAMQPTDRTPVVVEATFWGALWARGVRFEEFMRSPRHHLLHQILNYKWRCEQIHDDLSIETEKLVSQPDFGALRGNEFPIEVEWQPDQPAKSIHLLTEPEQIDSLGLPDP